MTKSRTALMALTTAAVVAVASLVYWRDWVKSALGDEPYKLCLQFSLITIIGGFVSYVFAEVRREQDLRESRRQSLRSFHLTIVATYNRAKRVRRLLRALALYKVNGVRYARKKDYVELMRELEDVQLEFEASRRQAKVAHDLFATAPEMERFFDSLEKYLREVLKEFERAQITEAQENIELEDLPRLRAFTDDKEDAAPGAGFVEKFSGRYDLVEASLLRLSLTVK